jgi:hypothetical protein
VQHHGLTDVLGQTPHDGKGRLARAQEELPGRLQQRRPGDVPGPGPQHEAALMQRGEQALGHGSVELEPAAELGRRYRTLFGHGNEHLKRAVGRLGDLRHPSSRRYYR